LREIGSLLRFAYEWSDDSNQRYRSYGNENWQIDANGIMHHRFASINDTPSQSEGRKTIGQWYRRHLRIGWESKFPSLIDVQD
jgi:nuclear transport factor 2 (NTF2) superfamily protein